MRPHLNLVKKGSGGNPVVFQHGLCGNAGQTAEVFPNDPRFQMFTLECRGHGASESGPIKTFSIKTFADDVADMVEAEEIAPCIMGGISMGAAISLNFAVHRPDLVKALVLARPAWCVESSPKNMVPNAIVGELLSKHPPQLAQAHFLETDTAKYLAKVAPDNLSSTAFSHASLLK
jgi:pimeloyl-ACP methyl ester carboxylesterase